MRQVMNHMGGFPYWNDCEMGFIDQFGAFIDREKAKVIALAAGQVFRELPSFDSHQTKLYSENLY